MVQEYRQRDLLRAHGLSPMRKLLLAGPPGTGKTMSASALAGELGLPMFTVHLDGLISQFLGETASKLRLVFDAVADTQGVYLFDEFDALGSERGVGNDPGEIRRALNSLLQFLESDTSESLLIGATNLVEILDKALFRRFDAVLNYSKPSSEIALELMCTRLVTLGSSDIDWGTVSPQVQDLSHAELKLACEQAAKDALLSGQTTVSTAALMASLNTRQAMSGGAR